MSSLASMYESVSTAAASPPKPTERIRVESSADETRRKANQIDRVRTMVLAALAGQGRAEIYFSSIEMRRLGFSFWRYIDLSRRQRACSGSKRASKLAAYNGRLQNEGP